MNINCNKILSVIEDILVNRSSYGTHLQDLISIINTQFISSINLIIDNVNDLDCKISQWTSKIESLEEPSLRQVEELDTKIDDLVQWIGEMEKNRSSSNCMLQWRSDNSDVNSNFITKYYSTEDLNIYQNCY